MDKPVIELEDVIFSSRVWRKISELLVERLEYSRIQLESCENIRDCIKYQTEIKLIKALLRLPETGKLSLES